MKIKMLTCLAGEEFTWNTGDVVEVDAEEGNRLCERGYAKKVIKAKDVETATAPTAKKRNKKG